MKAPITVDKSNETKDPRLPTDEERGSITDSIEPNKTTTEKKNSYPCATDRESQPNKTLENICNWQDQDEQNFQDWKLEPLI